MSSSSYRFTEGTVFSFFLTMALTLMLTACGGSDNNAPPPTPPTPPATSTSCVLGVSTLDSCTLD